MESAGMTELDRQMEELGLLEKEVFSDGRLQWMRGF